MNKQGKWLMVALFAILVVAGTGALLWGGEDLEASHQAVAAASHRDRGGSVWGANYFPNVPLITQDGETVHFFDDLIKGKVVAVNFIYTSCPDACPMETARMKEVQRLLDGRVGKDVFFYSITIDPENDTPEVLHEYVKNWQIGPGWTFLTGKEEDIIRLRKKLGVYIDETEKDGSLDHNLSLVIGNQATGQWLKRSPYENPYILATQLGSWLHSWKLPSKKKLDYANAPELRQISNGELLFRTRCASCHTIGEGDTRVLAERRVGPDLYNITSQRDRKWLERWLIAPDKMLEEKDPLATALFAQYNKVPMPNLRLNHTDVEAVLAHIEEESQRIDRQLESARMALNRDSSGMKPMDHGEHMKHMKHMDHAKMDHGDSTAAHHTESRD